MKNAGVAAPLTLALVLGACAREPSTPVPATPSATTAAAVPQDRYAKVNGVTLHYLDYGGSGDLLLLLHGLSHTAHSWDGIAPAFTDRYRVMAVTRRGHGSSEKTTNGFGIDTLVADISAFITAVGAKRVIVAGHSFAGREMPILAGREPDRIAAVIFLDAVYDWDTLYKSVATATGTASFQRSYQPPDSALASLSAYEDWQRRRFPSDWGPAMLATLRSQTLLQGDGRVGWQLPPEKTAPFIAGSQGVDFSAIHVPVLAVWANQLESTAANMKAYGFSSADVDTARSWITEVDIPSKRRGADALRRAVPEARIVELSAPHTLHWAKPADVIRLMNEFLATLPSH